MLLLWNFISLCSFAQAFITSVPIHKKLARNMVTTSQEGMNTQSIEASSLDILAKIKAGTMSIEDLLGPLHSANGLEGMTSGSVIGGTAPPKEAVQPSTFFTAAEEADVAPMDKFNTELVSNVHPPDYSNPTPLDEYDLVVIGAGVSGLLSVIMAKALGLKSALVERHYMGGDCLNVGCVPSKALISCARVLQTVRESAPFGVILPGGTSPAAATIDFPKVMARMREIRATISQHDSVARYSRDFCEHVFLGSATFTGSNTVTVAGTELKFRKAMIAVGGSAAVLPVLKNVPHLTNANLFNLEELPPRLCVIGGGPIGMEIAQSMARFGSKVTVLERENQILGREDPEAARVVCASLEKDGVVFNTGVDLVSVTVDSEKSGSGLYKAPLHKYRITYKNRSGDELSEKVLECDAVLGAAGRIANIEGLGLDTVGVALAPGGTSIYIDDNYKTTAPKGNIYSCGDCASVFKFTHSADWQARAAIRNMFLGDDSRISDLLIPWATYTDPEVAHVGLYERDCVEKGLEFEVLRRELAAVDRCKCEGVTEGFVKLLVTPRAGKILGATIVGPTAGDMISEITLAMQAGITAGTLAGVIHPYPTTQESVRQAAAGWNKYWRTPAVNAALDVLLAEKKEKDI